ncbi:SGNH hydrolase domain-containing protein [Flavobacterium sp. GNP001]
MKDQYNPCGCYIDGGTSIKSYKKEECLKISTTKRNILLIGDSHSAQYSKSFRENLKDENIIEVSAGFTFPFIDAIGKDDSKRLMNFLYSDFLPEQYKNIDIVVFSVHWPMYQYNLIDYSKEELKIKMLQLIKYYEDKRIKFIVLGQTESYLLPFPRIIAITKANEKANYDRYINKETSDLNNYLKSFKPKKNYIDIYNLKGIKKFDSKNKIPYMFDDSHLTKFGADQIVDYLIKSNFLDKKNK